MAKLMLPSFLVSLLTLSTAFALCTFTPIDTQAASPDSITQCSDWSSATPTFEQATAEYMRLALSGSHDFGCLSRASWFATEDLFSAKNSLTYIARLKSFDQQYRKLNAGNPIAEKAVEDLKVLLQLRWLSESYVSLKAYNSTTVIYGAAGASATALFVAGAAILLHSPVLGEIRSTARPALLRMVRYLGAMIFAKVTGEAVQAYHGDSPAVALNLRPPPMDLIGGLDQIFWNYTDLHLMRDIATATADSLAFSAVQATVLVLALKYVGPAASTGGFFSATSLVGLAIAYPVGQVVGHYTEKFITDWYHKSYAAETARLVEELRKPGLNDWQRYTLGAELTKGAIAWVSTQDLYLQSHIEESVSSFGYWQICTRLRQHTMRELFEKRQAMAIKREELLGRSGPQINIELTAQEERETQGRFTGYFTDAEKQLRSTVKSSIEAKKERLIEVRQGLVSRMKVLEDIDKPYMHDFIVQQNALLGRIDRYLTNAPIIDSPVDHIREQVTSLALSSDKWNDSGFMTGLAAEYNCN